MIWLYRFLLCFFFFCFYSFIHDVIIKSIYCYFRKKRNNCGKCYFYTCKHYCYCPYNNPKYFKIKTTIKELFKKD